MYRFILNAERVSKSRKDVVENAAKALNEHLKMRKCMKLVSGHFIFRLRRTHLFVF